MEGCSPRGERVTTGEIGSERFLFLGGAIETISRADPHRRRPLASIVALVLAAGFFAFCGGEARAQQSPQQMHVAVTDKDSLLATVEEVAGLAARSSPAEVLLAETPLARVLSDETYPVGLGSLANEPPDAPARADTALQPDPRSIVFNWYGAGTTPVGLVPEWRVLGDPGIRQEFGPLPGLETVSTPAATWPVAPGKNDSLPQPTGERSLANTPATGAHPAPPLESQMVSTVPAGPAHSSAVRGTLIPLAPGPSAVAYLPPSPPSPGATVGDLQSDVANAAANVTDTRASTPATGSGASSAPSSSETGDASESTPQQQRPSAPLAPLGGSSFSLSGGQAGPGSGLTPLLVCVLVSGLVLLRRDGLLFQWAPYEPPKPSSALLLPLERPG